MASRKACAIVPDRVAAESLTSRADSSMGDPPTRREAPTPASAESDQGVSSMSPVEEYLAGCAVARRELNECADLEAMWSVPLECRAKDCTSPATVRVRMSPCGCSWEACVKDASRVHAAAIQYKMLGPALPASAHVHVPCCGAPVSPRHLDVTVGEF
jgi:hypothetical protein